MLFNNASGRAVVGTLQGTLEVQELSACGWVTLFSISGDQGNSWIFASVPVSSAADSIVRFNYDYVGGCCTGDCSIDDVSLSGTALGPFVPGAAGSNLWQVNSPEANLTFDGVQGTSTDGAFVTTQIVLDPTGGVCSEGSATMDFSGNGLGGAYEIAFNSAPLVCAGNGAFPIAPGLQLNLDLTAGLGFMNGGAAPVVVPYPTAFPGSGTGFSFFVNVAFQTPATVSVQAVTVDATGLHLSQATSLSATTTQSGLSPLCPATVGGDLSPLSDDGEVVLTLAAGGFTFYGVNYTDIHVNMNGNLTFVAGNNDFAPSEIDFLNDEPRIAPAFSDWTPDDPAQGTVRAADNGTTLTIEWFDVRAFGLATCGGGVDSNSFCVTLTYPTNNIDMTWGFMGLCGGTVLDTIVGISPGGMLSTPFNVDLTAGPTPNPSGTGAIYEDFSQAAFGTFDLGAPGCGGLPGESIDFVSFAGTGFGPYIQN